MDELDNITQENENLFNEVDSQEQESFEPTQEEDRSIAHTYEDSETDDSDTDEDASENLYDGEQETEDDESDYDYTDGQYERFGALNYLRNMGYINDWEEDVRNYSEDDLDVFIQSKMDNMVNDRLRGALQQLPDIVQQLNEFALSGGDVRTFFSQIAQQNQQGIVEGMDLSDPYNQETVVYNTLQSQGYPQEYIQSQIEFLKSSNNLQNHANVYYNQFIANRREQLNAMVQYQQQQEYQARQAFAQQRHALDSYVQSINEVAGLSLSLRDKKELTDYMLTPAYTLEDGSTITQLQKDLYYDLIQNQETAIQLALLLKNRNSDGSLNLSSIKRQVETEITNKTKANLRRQNRNTPSSNSGKYPTYKQKSLDSYFD